MSLYLLKWAKTGWKNSALTQIHNLRFVILIPPSSFPLNGVRSFLLHSISSSTEIRPFGFLFVGKKKKTLCTNILILSDILNSRNCIILAVVVVATSCLATKFIEVEQSSSSKRWKFSEFCMFLSDVEVVKGPVLIYIALQKIWEWLVSAKLTVKQAVT